MSIPLIVEANSYQYPAQGDKANTGWGGQTTNWASAVTSALAKLGLGGTLSPIANAVINIDSTSKGILIPRMTTVQRDAITSPANSLLIFNTILKVVQYYDSSVSSWISIGARLPDNVQFSGTLTVTGIIYGSSVTLTGGITSVGVGSTTGNFTDATDATNADTAPLKTAGGMAVKKKLFVGTDANIGGNANVTGNANIGGDANVTGNILTGNGSVLLPSHSFISDPDTGLYRISNGVMGFVSNGIKRGEFGGSYGGFTGNLIQLNSFTQNFQTIITTVTFSNINSSSGVIWEISITPKLANSKIFILYKFGIAINLEYGGIKILNKINAGGTYSTIYDPQKTGNDQNGLEFGVQSSASYQLVNIPIIHSPVYNVGDTLFYKAMGSVYSAGQSLVINTLRTGTGANSGHSEAYILEIANI